MDEIIRVTNSGYAAYEEVLLRRARLKKEAFQLQRDYVVEFGDLIVEVFNQKLECIRMKKTIEYCQASLNYGKKVDQSELQDYLFREMKSFEKQMEDLIQDNISAKKRETISQLDVLKIKRIYRKLVKAIHPDINPLTNENPELSELWQNLQVAYNCNQLKDMEELEVLVTTAIDQLGVGTLEIEIPDIEEKIAAVEAEIREIMETDPYQYKYLLDDPEAVEAKRQSLKEELDTYKEYSRQLEEMITNLFSEGVNITWRMN